MAARSGARLIGPGDAEWPAEAVESFAGCAGPGGAGCGSAVGAVRAGPVVGRVAGDGVTVVGSRASSAYGQRVAGEMAHELASRGLTVISGAAFGIDTAAHRAALLVGGRGPVDCGRRRRRWRCWRAGSIGRIRRRTGRCWMRSARSGAVVSEYPPGTTPARHRFLVRNRLIAAFGAGTVVVEAGRRSGTLSTAAAAEQLGRLVMAVPGPVTSAMSVGCHLLLADRFAQLVTGADDVLAALGRHGHRAGSRVGGRCRSRAGIRGIRRMGWTWRARGCTTRSRPTRPVRWRTWPPNRGCMPGTSSVRSALSRCTA